MKHRVWLLCLMIGLSVLVQAQQRSLETCVNGEPTTAAGLPDADADTVADAVDNCVATANALQRDSDGDGFGNVCDADLDNNGVVNAADLGLLKSVFFSINPDLNADLDGDGKVALEDLAILRAGFFRPPGPTGACVANPASCAGPADFEFNDLGGDGQGNLFVFRTADPATIYHARRLLSGASECNQALSGDTFLGTQAWNPAWGFSINGGISFHGSSVNALVSCDRQAHTIEADLGNWCGDDTRATLCQFWCPWRSQLTREVSAGP